MPGRGKSVPTDELLVPRHPVRTGKAAGARQSYSVTREEQFLYLNHRGQLDGRCL